VSDGWYYLGREGHIGPLGLQELKRTLATFRNAKDVLVWHEGFPGWKRAGDVPELRARASLPPSQTGSRRDVVAKLPLWETIRLSYSSYFHGFPDVLRISWLWLAVVTPLWGMAVWLLFSLKADLVAAGVKRGPPPSIPGGMIVLVTIAVWIFTFAGVSSIAVAWHRRLILGEPPRFSGSNIATKSLWRYVWTGLAIGLIAFLPSLVVVLPILILLPSVITGAALKFVMFVAACFLISLTAFAVTLRLSLLLPARAIGHLGLTFRETWKRTHGNTWRMFWGIVACTVPPMVAPQVAVQIVLSVSFPSPRTPDGAGIVGGAAISAILLAFVFVLVCQLLTLPIWIGFLSHSYRHFFGRK
jgi:GYF domain 2